MTPYFFVLIAGLIASALSGIIATGSSIMLPPILVFQFGPKQAVPIMAIAALMSNVGKVLAWRHEIDWKAFGAYSIAGVPAADVGNMILFLASDAAARISGEAIAVDGDFCYEA